ncbi:hypothetical protein DFP72DRAFT_1057095 [Ephemerocybe angulata]|uniref:Uncharacterized protein n=1 Tax=Ephemerocybe angulata TaxID=980116 RepID=A0A8H6MHP7_9AGAR|nr:hypothetical protein DFP72DRAFT_1057095 [Tulosesus angulatus]
MGPDQMYHHTIFCSVPEEVTKQILERCIAIPDDLFCDHSHSFGNYHVGDESSSVLLEVCRRWMHVGTPLLYETIVLRTKSQTLALKATLEGNPALCKYVKKIRVEESQGMAIASIMEWCQNTVTHIFIDLRPLGHAADSSNGLQKGLQFAHLNPRDAFLQFFQGTRQWYHAELDSLGIRLIQAVSTCTSLKYIYLARFPRLHDSLDHLSKIQTLVEVRLTDGWMDGDQVVKLSKDDRHFLKKFRPQDFCLKNARHNINLDLSWKTVLESGENWQTFRQTGSCKRTIAIPSPAISLDITALDVLDMHSRTSILNRIMSHLVDVKPIDGYLSPPPSDSGIWKGGHFKAISCVSQELRNISVPWLFSDITLISVTLGDFDKFLHTTGYGKYIRHMRTGAWPTVTRLYSNPDFYHVLQQCTGLLSLTDRFRQAQKWMTGLTPRELGAISRIAGGSLQRLDVPISQDTPPLPPSVDVTCIASALLGFRFLRSLNWTSGHLIKLQENTSLLLDALPCLTALTYASSNNSLLNLLSRMKLPSLEELIMPEEDRMSGYKFFLWTHRSKLRCLSLSVPPTISGLFTRWCPNLAVLTLKTRASKAFTMGDPWKPLSFNEVLENWALELVVIIHAEREREALLKKELNFLKEVSLSGFKNLKSVQFRSHEWPVDQ